MMGSPRLALALCLACALPVHAQKTAAPEEVRLAALAKEAGLDGKVAQTPQAREQLLAELTMREIVGERARAMGLDQRPEVAAAMELAALSALGQAYMEAKAAAPDEATIEADWRSAYPPKDLAKVKVAMFKDQKKAREALDKLRAGAPMKEIAQLADDQQLASRGGDLGWIALDALPAPLVEALKDPARWPASPVPTPYGFAVYELDGRKTAPENSLDEARSELLSRRQELARRVELGKLREEAKNRLAKGQ